MLATGDPRYVWLNTLLAAWEGRFNVHTRSARYRAFTLGARSHPAREPEKAAAVA